MIKWLETFGLKGFVIETKINDEKENKLKKKLKIPKKS